MHTCDKITPQEAFSNSINVCSNEYAVFSMRAGKPQSENGEYWNTLLQVQHRRARHAVSVLHDRLGIKLVLLRQHLELAKLQHQDHQEVFQLIEEACAETRVLSQEMENHISHKGCLKDSLYVLVERFQEEYGMQAHLNAYELDDYYQYQSEASVFNFIEACLHGAAVLDKVPQAQIQVIYHEQENMLCVLFEHSPMKPKIQSYLMQPHFLGKLHNVVQSVGGHFQIDYLNPDDITLIAEIPA